MSAIPASKDLSNILIFLVNNYSCERVLEILKEESGVKNIVNIATCNLYNILSKSNKIMRILFNDKAEYCLEIKISNKVYYCTYEHSILLLVAGLMHPNEAVRKRTLDIIEFINNNARNPEYFMSILNKLGLDIETTLEEYLKSYTRELSRTHSNGVKRCDHRNAIDYCRRIVSNVIILLSDNVQQLDEIISEKGGEERLECYKEPLRIAYYILVPSLIFRPEYASRINLAAIMKLVSRNEISMARMSLWRILTISYGEYNNLIRLVNDYARSRVNGRVIGKKLFDTVVNLIIEYYVDMSICKLLGISRGLPSTLEEIRYRINALFGDINIVDMRSIVRFLSEIPSYYSEEESRKIMCDILDAVKRKRVKVRFNIPLLSREYLLLRGYRLVIDPGDIISQIVSVSSIFSCISPERGRFEYALDYIMNIIKGYPYIFWATVRDRKDRVVGRVMLIVGKDPTSEDYCISRISKIYGVYVEEDLIDNVLRKYAKECGLRYKESGEILIPNGEILYGIIYSDFAYVTDKIGKDLLVRIKRRKGEES